MILSDNYVEAAVTDTRRNIGEVVHSLLPIRDHGLHLLNGDVLPRSGIYVNFYDYVEKIFLRENMPGVFISEEIGVEKPGIGFFDEVFKAIGPYNKSEVIIIGDSLTSDIKGGNNAGIVTCWFNPENKPNDMNLNIDYEITDLAQVLDILQL